MHGPTCVFWANLTPFSLQYLVEFRTGSWKTVTRGRKDKFGRNRFEVPDANQGTYVSDDGHTFVGSIASGVPMTGAGVFSAEDGNVYDGTWESGKGAGKIVGSDAAVYDGEWIDLWPTTGKGTFCGADGNLYVPDNTQWESGSGEGSVTHVNTSTMFWGTWEDRRPIEGRGKWVNRRGQTLEGNWSGGEGMGMITSDEGEVVFEGAWRDEMPHKGKGAWRDADDNVYEGEWRNGILYGKDLSKAGLRVGSDLSKMVVEGDGSGADGPMSDRSSSSRADSERGAGRRKEAKMEIQAAIKPKAGHRLVTGRQFEGEWRDSAPWSGLGMWRGRMAHVFDGNWRNGRPYEGKGGWLSEEGWVFDGELRNGRVVAGVGKWRDVVVLQYPPAGDLLPADGRVFEGEWRDGVPYSGEGLWWDGHNHIYDGRWSALEGKGRIIMCAVPEVTEGGIYEGKWRGGLPLAGSGLWVDLDGYVYEGEWKDAMPFSGQGEWNYAASVYNGRWEDGKGAGRITGSEGGRYKGSWRGWRPWIGQGEFTDPEGHAFKGDYKDGAPTDGTGDWKSDGGHIFRGDLKARQPWKGEGSFQDVKRKCVYEGMWQEGSGEGNIYGQGEEVFRGRWRNEVPYTGSGSWRNIHGKVLEGEWEQGEGAGVIVGLEHGEVYDGAWADGDGAPTTGTGSWFSEEGYGNMFKGAWKDSKGQNLHKCVRGECQDPCTKEKWGTITNPNGRKFVGQWWNLVPYKGKGVYRGPDGFDFEGEWKDGVRVWRGRKWKDSETMGASFVLRRSRFTMGRLTPAERAAEAQKKAGGVASIEQQKSATAAIAGAPPQSLDSPTSRWVADHADSEANSERQEAAGSKDQPQRIRAGGGGIRAGAAVQHKLDDLEDAALEDDDVHARPGRLSALRVP
jgi:hypothetical protein